MSVSTALRAAMLDLQQLGRSDSNKGFGGPARAAAGVGPRFDCPMLPRPMLACCTRASNW